MVIPVYMYKFYLEFSAHCLHILFYCASLPEGCDDELIAICESVTFLVHYHSHSGSKQQANHLHITKKVRENRLHMLHLSFS